jgi:8-amino-7-oxononanoate synthase
VSAELDAWLRAEMSRWESRGLRRDLDAQSQRRVEKNREFTSNDYLSFADHPKLAAAAHDAIERFGVGGRAARLLGGGCELDRRAELAVAEWLGAEAALLFPSGWQANAGLMCALAGLGDVIFSDERNHASIIDAARLSRARTFVYRHLDFELLEAQLVLARGASKRIIVTESVFSMDGDLAPLLELHDLCARHDAFLVIDEAHATGVIGPRATGGWGAADPDGAIARSKQSRLAALLVTGGKALGVSGAFVVGSRALREHLANRARPFVFTTAVSPAVSGALCAAIELAQGSHDAVKRAMAAAQRVARALALDEPAAAIVPFIVGESDAAVALSSDLLAQGLDVRAVRPPTVSEGSARLRIACHAHNDVHDVQALIDALSTTRRVKPERRSDPIVVSTHARVLCVVGTDTDVGKTVVSALLARAALRHGPATYWKPLQTGAASDTDEVARLAGPDLALVDPLYRFPLAASPHTAAAAAGARIDFAALRARCAMLRAEYRGTLILELAGGLLVPYDDEHTQADLIALERPEIVLVARSGLGTLNHTLLTLEGLAARSLVPAALFLVGPKHAENAATLRLRSGIKRVFEVPALEAVDMRGLDGWLDRHDLGEFMSRPNRP